jgi:hypothetical protein
LLHGNKDKLWLEKNGNKVVLDIVVQTPKGVVYCMYFKRIAQDAKVGSAMVEKKMTMNHPHDVFTHHGTEWEIRLMAEARNIELIPGNLKSCKACTIDKPSKKMSRSTRTCNHQKQEDGSSLILQR